MSAHLSSRTPVRRDRPASRWRSTPLQSPAVNFGELVRVARRNNGRPIEELAPLGGLTASEWEAIEAGHIPGCVEVVYLLMQALQLGKMWKPYLMELFIRAWKE